jgi:prevent-host-death family protein
MFHVNVTELRQRLPAYLKQVSKGKEIKITVRGRVIARLIPEPEAQEAARQRLIILRKKSRVGDVISPTGEKWDAERDPA